MMRAQGTIVNLACLGPVDASYFTAIPGTIYEVGMVDLDAVSKGEGACIDGEQYISSSAPIGLIVGGMDWGDQLWLRGWAVVLGAVDAAERAPGLGQKRASTANRRSHSTMPVMAR
jgi:hypothetical protein